MRILLHPFPLPRPYADMNMVVAAKSKKHKKKRGGKAKPNGDTSKTNGVTDSNKSNQHEDEEDEQESQTPSEPPSSPLKSSHEQNQSFVNGVHQQPSQSKDTGFEEAADVVPNPDSDSPTEPREESTTNEMPAPAEAASHTSDADAGLKAMAEERDSLRAEVARFRESLKAVEEKHEQELATLREQLVETQEGKNQAEAQYKGLLGKVSTIRSQLGERLKADAVRGRFLLQGALLTDGAGGLSSSTYSNRGARRAVRKSAF